MIYADFLNAAARAASSAHPQTLSRHSRLLARICLRAARFCIAWRQRARSTCAPLALLLSRGNHLYNKSAVPPFCAARRGVRRGNSAPLGSMVA